MPNPDIALLVSTYQKPGHLNRALLSIAFQHDVVGKMEVVVTDYGSTDETPTIVDEFARSVDFPVHFTTHRHAGFQLSRCRNEGAAASSAPYLLFLDGDCVLPPDHVAKHLQFRRPGVAVAGDCLRLEQTTSERVTESAIRSGEFVNWIPRREKRRMFIKSVRAKLYNLIGHSVRPRLIGNNIGIWRDDFEQVNGFDESFVGWGLEDTDLQYRLARRGVRFVSIAGKTCTCHLWHPPTPSFVPRARGTNNEILLHQRGRLTRCRNGLTKRQSADLSVRLFDPDDHVEFDPSIVHHFGVTSGPPEVEVAFAPGTTSFSGTAECNLLVVLEGTDLPEALAKEANLVITHRNTSHAAGHLMVRPADVEHWLSKVA